MKCPYCGKRKAKLNPKLVTPHELIINAIDCRNPKCKAYNPIAFGYRADMLPEHHQTYRKFRQIIKQESGI